MKQSEVERELAVLANELEEVQARQEALFTRRLMVWLTGRDLGMTQSQLSIPSRVSEGAVTQALRKHRLRSDGASVA